MPTKLSRYADAVMEACWLAAIIVVPVFFNVYSSRIFEPDKITLLRTLALVILAAWLVKLLEEHGPRWDQVALETPRWKSFLRIPLIAPALALALVYLISTMFSVVPWTSLAGSYQRLQGTYSSFAYLVVFAALAGNLRRRDQVERLIQTAVLASLPVSLYGVLQHYGADPIPWGGDVSGRIASNMGNSIFVAAYLIMVFPVTAMRVVESFESLVQDRGRLALNLVRSTLYVFILALQVLAIYFSGSRGPWLGWAASLVLLWLGLSLTWRKRWMTITGVVLAVSAAAFLIVLNIPNGPLESLRARPEFGRLGQLLDSESRTGRVRELIWQGAAELVQPHAPLKYPDGSADALNFIRPLIGYGPESMYVAYNPFYPSELTQVEKRNASPDRSHNETWDSLVTTGILGLIVYLVLFGSILYYGLKWLGLIHTRRQRGLFLAFYLLGGTISTVAFVVTRGLFYLGVALPFGIILGVILYLILVSLFGHVEGANGLDDRLRMYILLGLLGGIVAHFVEINFGIAIAATRTYFWAYAGLMLVVGYLLPLRGIYRHSAPVAEAVQPQSKEAAGNRQPEPASSARPASSRDRRVASGARRPPAQRRARGTSGGLLERLSTGWTHPALIASFIVAVILVTLGYEYISNASRQPSAISLIWSSLTSLANRGSSFGILSLLLTTWLVGVILLTSESFLLEDDGAAAWLTTWSKMAGLALGLSLLFALIFWLWHASNLVSLGQSAPKSAQELLDQVARSEQLLTAYYIYLFALILLAAIAFPIAWPQSSARWPGVSQVAGLAALVVAFTLGASTNLRIIQADMSFKAADLFARPGSWPIAIDIYDRANNLAPSEDYYYLFLGRAYLEHAKTLQDPTERDTFIQQAANDLHKAQELNPLNTDHTANLARLYSLWASFVTDPTRRSDLAQKSNDYFAQAVALSPHNARLWDEWAVLYLNILSQPKEAIDRLQQALSIDPYYDWTYAMLGDYYSRFVATDANLSAADRQQALAKATEYYRKAISLLQGDPNMLENYLLALGSNLTAQNDLSGAISAYEQALETNADATDAWRVQVALAHLYSQTGNLPRAVEYARQALQGAPQDQQPGIKALISQLGG